LLAGEAAKAEAEAARRAEWKLAAQAAIAAAAAITATAGGYMGGHRVATVSAQGPESAHRRFKDARRICQQINNSKAQIKASLRHFAIV
jgi:hypothetical protein